MKQKIMVIWAIVFGVLTSVSFYMVIHEKRGQSIPAVSTQVKLQPDKKQAAAGENKDPNALVIQPGKRAISVPVNEYEGVSGFIQPGSYIDVNVIVKGVSNDPLGDANLSAHVLLQNIKVLATGIKKTVLKPSDSQAKDNQPNTASNNQDIYHEVVLEVTPAEGIALTLAAKKGTVYLTLRAPNDALKVGHTGMSLEDVSKGEIAHEHQMAR